VTSLPSGAFASSTAERATPTDRLLPVVCSTRPRPRLSESQRRSTTREKEETDMAVKLWNVKALVYPQEGRLRDSGGIEFKIQAPTEELARRRALDYVWSLGHYVDRFYEVQRIKEKH
jgi:hypothetical protein